MASLNDGGDSYYYLETGEEAAAQIRMMHHLLCHHSSRTVWAAASFRFRAIVAWPPVHEVVYRRVPKHLPLVRWDDLIV